MTAYGMSKAAVHHLVKSIADEPHGGLPAGSKVCAVLPVTIDTPTNRQFMADADFSTWTPAGVFAEQIMQWSGAASGQPADDKTKYANKAENGGLYAFYTEGGETEVVQCH